TGPSCRGRIPRKKNPPAFPPRPEPPLPKQLSVPQSCRPCFRAQRRQFLAVGIAVLDVTNGSRSCQQGSRYAFVPLRFGANRPIRHVVNACVLAELLTHCTQVFCENKGSAAAVGPDNHVDWGIRQFRIRICLGYGWIVPLRDLPTKDADIGLARQL